MSSVTTIVLDEAGHQVPAPRRATPPLEPVVRARIHLDILQHRPITHTAHRQAVELGVRRKDPSRVPDRHIPQRTRTVAVVVSAKPVLRIGKPRVGIVFQPLILVELRGRDVAHRLLGAVDHRIAHDHHPAPQRTLRRGNVTVEFIPFGRENDRPVHRPGGIELAALAHPQGRYQLRHPAPPDRHVGRPLHHRPRLDDQRRVGLHVDHRLQHILVVRRPRHFRPGRDVFGDRY
jgi:hypothetical protein